MKQLLTKIDWYRNCKNGKNCYLIGCFDQRLIKCEKCQYYFCKEHDEDHSHGE